MGDIGQLTLNRTVHAAKQSSLNGVITKLANNKLPLVCQLTVGDVSAVVQSQQGCDVPS